MTEESTAPIRRKMFVKASTVPKLSPDRLKRQSQITQFAFAVLADRSQAIGFLNQANPSLGGRPLAIATDSAEGYAAVEKAVRLLAAPHVGSAQ